MSPRLPKRQDVELSQKNLVLRIVLFVLALAIGVGAFAAAVSSCTAVETGWQTITASGNATLAAKELSLLYHVGSGTMSAKAEQQAVAKLFASASDRGHWVFSAEQVENVANLCALNGAPNTAVTVEPELYAALELLRQQESRWLYLGPLQEVYASLLCADEDWEAAEADPYENETLRQFCQKIANFAANPQKIDVELLGNGQVKLKISQDYLDFAAENEVGKFLDFGWLKNAFVVDLVADSLAAENFTQAVISSYEGFGRGLCEESLANNLITLEREKAVQVCTLSYTGPMTVVHYRSYPLTGLENMIFYTYSDGRRRVPYLTASDGLCRYGASEMTVLSKESCALTAVQTLPLFAADRLDEARIEALEQKNIHCIYLKEKTVVSRWGDLKIEHLLDGYTIG